MARQPAKENVRRARTELYRGLILEAAERIFAEAGFEDAKMQEIAAEAGLSLGTLYSVFPGKADLYRAVHESRLGELLDCARVAAPRNASPLEQLLDGMAAYVEYLTAHPDFLRMHLCHGTAWGLSPTQHSGEQVSAWQEGLELQAQAFRRGIDEGIFYGEGPDLMSRMLTAMHQVQLSNWIEHGMNEDPAALIERMQAQLRRTFVRPDAPTG